MIAMRRKERAVIDEGGIRRILDQCRVCRIAMQSEAGLYIVPLSYGYRWDEKGLRLYFHGAKQGRKLDLIKSHPDVAFEMDEMVSLIEGKTACMYSCAYCSLTGTARASIVEDAAEKSDALSAIMLRQTGKPFDFTPDMTASVCVLRLDVREISGKENMPHGRWTESKSPAGPVA